MGVFFNPSNRLMKQDVQSKIYIDKSLLIKELNALINTNDNFLCVSRPRRFGKSMASNMLAAYYSKGCDSKDIFSKLKISKEENWQENLNAFNVIQMDLNGFYHSIKNPDDLIPEMTKAIVSEMKAEIYDAGLDENDTLPSAIMKAYNKTGETFILIFDEYDVLVREKAKPSIFESYLDFLSSLFKNNNIKAAISLAYLTGILPIVRSPRPYAPALVVQSKMNEFDEYSMTNARSLAPFAGFTEEEVRSQWILSIKNSTDYAKVMELVNDSKNLLQHTLDSDTDYVAQSLTNAHMRSTNPLTYNNEASFQSAIGLAYFYATAQYTIIKELPTGKGYADVAFIPFVPNLPAIIIELKNNKSAQSALKQIKERKYDDALSNYRGNMLFVGINYDENTKKHECIIEKI